MEKEQEFNAAIDEFFTKPNDPNQRKKSISIIDEDGYKFSIKIVSNRKSAILKIDTYGELSLQIPYSDADFYWDNIDTISKTRADVKLKNLPYPTTKLEKWAYNANISYGLQSKVESMPMFKIDPQKIIAVAKVTGEFYNHENDTYSNIKDAFIVKYIGHEPEFVYNKENSNDSGYTLPKGEEKECIYFDYYADKIFEYNIMFGREMYLRADAFNIENKHFAADQIHDGIGNQVYVENIKMKYVNEDLINTLVVNDEEENVR